MLGSPAEAFGKPGDMFKARHTSRHISIGLVAFRGSGRIVILPGLTDVLKGCQGRLKVKSLHVQLVDIPRLIKVYVKHKLTFMEP